MYIRICIYIFYESCNDINVNATVRPIRYEVDSVITKKPCRLVHLFQNWGGKRLWWTSWCLPLLFYHRHYHLPILLAIVANWKNSNDNKLKRGNRCAGSIATWFRFFPPINNIIWLSWYLVASLHPHVASSPSLHGWNDSNVPLSICTGLNSVLIGQVCSYDWASYCNCISTFVYLTLSYEHGRSRSLW